MLKKTLALYFLLICQLIFSKEVSISVTNELGVPLENAYINFENTIKKTDKKGIAVIDTDSNIVSFFVEKTNYKSQQLTINLNNENEIDVVMKNSYDFYINLYKSNSVSYDFQNADLPDETIKDGLINIYKDGNLVKTLDYYGKELGIDLKDGTYNIIVYTIFSEPVTIKSLKFDSQKSKYLNIKTQVKSVKISGIIINNNTLLGGAKLTFKKDDKSFVASTGIEGKYEIELPVGNYDLLVEKEGYESIKTAVSVSSSNDFTYNLKEIPSTIKGRILDSKGTPVGNKSIYIKNNDKEILVNTNDKGYYEAKVYGGLAFVKVNISGFFPTGRVEKIDSLSTKTVEDIYLKERISSLNGTITDGVLPLAGINVKLYDANNSYFGMRKTDSKGYFSFQEIKSGIPYNVVIEDSGYGYYKSNTFVNEDNENRNLSVILNNNDVNFILELKNTTKAFDYSALNVYVNNIKFQPDKNGIINESIKSIKVIENIVIEIPKIGVKNTYKISELGSKPYLITITF